MLLILHLALEESSTAVLVLCAFILRSSSQVPPPLPSLTIYLSVPYPGLLFLCYPFRPHGSHLLKCLRCEVESVDTSSELSVSTGTPCFSSQILFLMSATMLHSLPSSSSSPALHLQACYILPLSFLVLISLCGHCHYLNRGGNSLSLLQYSYK